MTKETKLRICAITDKVILKFSNEAWVLKKRGEQRLEASQMTFLRHLLEITKLDREKNSQQTGKYNSTIKSGYNGHKIEYPSRHCSIMQKGGET